ncbi:hypothetical protein [Chryseobacterium taklimakanense]|uniref:Uncharacterized protein n=1 Tax=Chryseobacterium taklimakanense TaxID=536441 RepID=A0A3G8WHE4_9FLAO|nr:hypothetical protein [Chryseobacterium taklimakanense]AZI20610.1 hypothetical protein EIH08_07675 [Chryseobacterium taklimakanense]
MTKFTLAVLTLYILYYSGNIFYDLYFKKTPEKNKPDAEELFSLSDMADKDQPEITQVGIEDVETLNTPSSFTSNYSEAESLDNSENLTDLEALRRKFELEEALLEEDFSKLDKINTSENVPQPEIIEERAEQPKPVPPVHDYDEERERKFREMLNLAETTVQVLDIDGIRTYQSSLF